MNERPLPIADLVLVTGASGYIALHCVKQLLEHGYMVRGTVRNLRNTEKVQPLRDLNHSDERLELVEADLECPDHWISAVKDCTYILHVASPWPIVASQETIQIAKNGTLNVLKAAANAGTIKKVVLTSSCAAINDGHKNSERIFDENCWSNLSSKRIENYGRSKTIAEQTAWRFWNDLPEKLRFQLTVLNPTFVTGPVLSNQEHGSATIIKRMMDYRTFPAIPKVSLGIVDVRDVAYAHLRALQSRQSDGQRILITSIPTVWFAQISGWLHKEFKRNGFVISRLVVPNWLLKMYAKTGLDPHLSAIRYRLGPQLRYNNMKSKKLLNMEYINPRDSVIDMVYSMMEYGMLAKTRQPNNSCSDSVAPTLSTYSTAVQLD